MQSRTQKEHTHRKAIRRVRDRLRRLGIASALSSDDANLIVGDNRIAVRGAYSSEREHRVKVRGKSYSYRYRRRMWNFQAHGKLTMHPDFWILVEMDGRGIYVVPASEVEGTRLTAHQQLGRRHRGNWFDRYDGAFDSLVRAHRRAA